MREFRIDEQSGIPVWIQVRRRLVYTIVSGQYGPGDQLPTVRELAVQLDINYNTVNKVYQDLERDGLIVTRRGRGTFVADVGANGLLALDNKIELLADELVREGLDFGMTGDEIVGAVRTRVAQHEALKPSSAGQEAARKSRRRAG
ncbi:MAG: GntR family transcriptional regulator [Coriobacteriales bacterium]|jgi:GntR family transcriptional regulator|nr:GntR family transcriptional regulator [Coriobacteriales bacterium]